MEFCVICSLRKFNHSQELVPGLQHASDSGLTRELENMQIFSLNSVFTLHLLLVSLVDTGSGRIAHGTPCVRLSKSCWHRPIADNFSLHSVLAVSGSKLLYPVVLTLLIYTISLRLAVNACFLQVSILFYLFPALCDPSSESPYTVEISSCCTLAHYILHGRR